MKCIKCDAEIYGNGITCPICGSSLKSNLKISKIFLIVIAIPILAGFLMNLMGIKFENNSQKNNVQSKPSSFDKYLEEVKNIKLINDYEHYYDHEKHPFKDSLGMMNKIVGATSDNEIFPSLGNEYIIELYVKFENHNSFPVKDIKYICRHYSGSGTQIKTNEGIKYTSISANGYTNGKLKLGFRHDDESYIKCSCTGFTQR